MAQKKPKVILFDIGGVISPFQAILDYELSHGIPLGWVNNCISKTKPNGFWHRLERGELLMDKDWFAGFTSDLNSENLWKEFHASQREKLKLPEKIPPVPQIDGEYLFWEMMRASRDPDPWMFPALQRLSSSKKYLLAALSNTVIFPPSHPYSETSPSSLDPSSPRFQLNGLFKIFISSAHIGLRKPDPAIYQYALSTLNSYALSHAFSEGKGLGWENGVKAEDILFLDDIGENLKAAKANGFGTLKVNLGRTYEAVEELERITGLRLEGEHPKVPVLPRVSKGAKL